MKLGRTPAIDPDCGCVLEGLPVKRKAKKKKGHCAVAGKRVLGCFASKRLAKQRAREHNDNPKKRTTAVVVGR